jgi:hypothetical protein
MRHPHLGLNRFRLLLPGTLLSGLLLSNLAQAQTLEVLVRVVSPSSGQK